MGLSRASLGETPALRLPASRRLSHPFPRNSRFCTLFPPKAAPIYPHTEPRRKGQGGEKASIYLQRQLQPLQPQPKRKRKSHPTKLPPLPMSSSVQHGRSQVSSPLYACWGLHRPGGASSTLSGIRRPGRTWNGSHYGNRPMLEASKGRDAAHARECHIEVRTGEAALTGRSPRLGEPLVQCADSREVAPPTGRMRVEVPTESSCAYGVVSTCQWPRDGREPA